VSKEPSPAIAASTQEAFARAGQLAQHLSPQPVKLAASSAAQVPVQAAASNSVERFPAPISSSAVGQLSQPAAGSAVKAPIQTYASSPMQRYPAQDSSPAASRPPTSSAPQLHVHANAHLQRFPAQSVSPAGARQNQGLSGIAEKVIASLTKKPGHPAASNSAEGLPSLPSSDLPKPWPNLPQSPFKALSQADSGPLQASSAPRQAPTASGKQAPQAVSSAGRTPAQANSGPAAPAVGSAGMRARQTGMSPPMLMSDAQQLEVTPRELAHKNLSLTVLVPHYSNATKPKWARETLCSRLCRTCSCQGIDLGPGEGPGSLTLPPKLGLSLTIG